MRSEAFTDPRSKPAYTVSEAARYLKVANATLRSWVAGRPYPKSDGVGQFRPLIHPPSRKPPLLSFWNLIEAHVLRSLRTDHNVSLGDVRRAIAYAEKTLGIKNLLLSKELRTQGGDLLLERYGELIDLSASGQIAMRRLFQDHVARVEWDERQFPMRLYPFVSGEMPSPGRPIAIDPAIAFGRPVVVRLSIGTSTIADRIDAGEPAAEIATDYGLELAEVEQAVVYERAA
jgi:uncharacterized protein (DUF433 family)